MHSIQDILRQKGTVIWSVSPDDTVLNAIHLMAEHEVGALLVLQDGQPLGLFSERDYSRKLILEGRRSQDTRVGTVMRTTVLTISPDATVQEGLPRMTDKFVRNTQGAYSTDPGHSFQAKPSSAGR